MVLLREIKFVSVASTMVSFFSASSSESSSDELPEPDFSLPLLPPKVTKELTEEVTETNQGFCES